MLGLSGALALVYETLWLRRFTALFGAGAPAAAATISALFAGLASGSAWFGPRVARWRRPLRVYAGLELGVAAGAALVEPITERYADLAPLLADEAVLTTALVKTALVFLALFVPTFLLGGTLPAALAAADDGRPECTGRLYAANTFGAVAGVLATTFWLLPAFGAQVAYRFALALSVLTGLSIWLLEAGAPLVRAKGAEPGAERAPAGGGIGRTHALAFVSGLLLLAAEVAWMRMLAQVHPNSLAAFASVLALFLASLAGGAWLAAELLRRGFARERLLQGAWLVAGFLTLAGPLLFHELTDGMAVSVGSGAGATGRLLLVAGASLVPATIAGGVVLPLLLTRAPGASLGGVLAANTLGSVLGPLLAAFALFPWLGLWATFVGLGAAQLLCARPWAGPRRFAPALVLVLAGLCTTRVLALPRVHVDARRGESLLWLGEGSHGIVAALEVGGERRLKLDNAYTLGGTGSAGDARMLGHVPLLLHEAPRRVAFLGLGTGLTASAVLRHPFEEAVVYELVPEVAAGVRAAFSEANLGLLDDPRVRLVLDDATHHLAAERRAFDVIVGDLVVPWRRGESALLAREHFERARGALRPGGIFCAWLPLYQLGGRELEVVLATFADVFPTATLWRGDWVAGQPTLGLVGLPDGHVLDAAAVDARVVAGAAGLVQDSRYLAHPAGFWLHLVGALEPLAAELSLVPRNTRDHPVLELGLARERAPFLDGTALLPWLARAEGGGAVGALAGLDAVHRAYQLEGGKLFRASALADAGREEEARTRAFEVLANLPGAIRDSLFPPGEPSPADR